MFESPLKDYYEVLQVSPRADRDTIERVFRYLANRFHPDNRETGDAERFREIVEAYELLSSAAKRAQYDLSYERVREARWRMFSQDSVDDNVPPTAEFGWRSCRSFTSCAATIRASPGLAPWS